MPSHCATPPTLSYFETVLLSYPAWPWAHPVFRLGGRQRWRLLSLWHLTISCTKPRAMNVEVRWEAPPHDTEQSRQRNREDTAGACNLSCLSYTFSLWYKTRDSLMNPPRNHSVCKTMAILVEGAEENHQCGQEQNREAWQTLGTTTPSQNTRSSEANHFRSYSQVWDLMTTWKYTSYKPCDTKLFHVNRYVMWTK